MHRRLGGVTLSHLAFPREKQPKFPIEEIQMGQYSACKGRELDPTTPEQSALFGELDPVPVCFFQLVGKRYPLKAVRTHTRKNIYIKVSISQVKNWLTVLGTTHPKTNTTKSK